MSQGPGSGMAAVPVVAPEQGEAGSVAVVRDRRRMAALAFWGGGLFLTLVAMTALVLQQEGVLPRQPWAPLVSIAGGWFCVVAFFRAPLGMDWLQHPFLQGRHDLDGADAL